MPAYARFQRENKIQENNRDSLFYKGHRKKCCLLTTTRPFARTINMGNLGSHQQQFKTNKEAQDAHTKEKVEDEMQGNCQQQLEMMASS